LPQVLAVPGIRMTETVGIHVSFNRPVISRGRSVVHLGD